MNKTAQSRFGNLMDILRLKSVTSGKDKTFTDVLKDLAESSSLHGVPKIVSSRQIAVKLLWGLLFVATFSVLVYQLSGLFRTYYAYPIQTSVSIDFNSIDFPAISICNMNPVRLTKLNLSETINEAMEIDEYSIQLEKRSTNERGKTYRRTKRVSSAGNRVKHFNAGTKVGTFEQQMNVMLKPSPVIKMNNIPTPGITPEFTHMSGLDITTRKSNTGNNKPLSLPSLLMKGVRRRKRMASVSPMVSASQTTPDTYSSVLPTQSGWQTNESNSPSFWSGWQTDDSNSPSVWTGWHATQTTDYWSTWQSQIDWTAWNSWAKSEYEKYLQKYLNAKADAWDSRIEHFRRAFKYESQETRQLMGHQKEDLIMSATFAGGIEDVTEFESFTSSEYGNCYTMTSPKYIAWRSGPTYGIKLTLNLEIEEYVHKLSTGYGIRLLLHEPGTYPLPSNEGIILGPGTETSIGLKMVQLSRLADPYGDCSDGQEFVNKYGIKYSTAACYHFCRIEKTMEYCGCVPVDAPDVIDVRTTGLLVCNTTDTIDKGCLLELDLYLSNGELSCNCREPCNEFIYEKTLSTRYWPTVDYVKVLLAEVCKKEDPDRTDQMKEFCGNIETVTYEEYQWLRNHFLRVLIHFEDLNFETISETPMYESVRFLSDIGGATGLFLGASVLSLVEILQLLLEIGLYIRKKIKAKSTTKVQVLN